MGVETNRLVRSPYIRWTVRSDMDAVLNIERHSFGEDAWSDDDYLRVLRQRNAVGMSALVKGETIAGYMVYLLHERCLELVRMAVHPDWRRRGVASEMVATLKRKLCPAKRTSISLVVGERGLGAQCFFRAMGFRATGVLRGHFEDSGEDGYQMRYDLPGEGGDGT